MYDEDFRAMTAGVRPGGLNKTYEIKILLCYMLSRANSAVTVEQLTDAIMSEELANYFEVANAVGVLLSEGLILRMDGSEGLELTDKGRTTATELGGSLPLTVRERAETALIELLRRTRRMAEVPIEIKKTEDGYELLITIMDSGTPLLKLGMYMPTYEQCTAIQERVRKNPLSLYKGVFALTTGNDTTLAAAIKELEV